MLCAISVTSYTPKAKRVMPFCGAYLDNAKNGYDPLPFAGVGSNVTMLKELTVGLTLGACACSEPASVVAVELTPRTFDFV